MAVDPSQSHGPLPSGLFRCAPTALSLLATVLVSRMPAVEVSWELGPTGTQASLRGLSAVDDQTIWACGSGATVLRSVDGGSSWRDCGPSGFAQLEFRSIHAWSETSACLASAGTPAVILRTDDGGDSWDEVYRCDARQAFFDALRFWDDQRGIAFSDPADGKLLVVQTHDGGKHWQPVATDLLPPALEGEAGFAASNSSLCVGAGGRIWIGTGGVVSPSSRIHMRAGWAARWEVVTCPLPSGPAQGIFSIAARRPAGSLLVAVGGDYRLDAESKQTAAFSNDFGTSWQLAKTPPSSYRSAVVGLPATEGSTITFIATGPTGSDYSTDGSDWTLFSHSGFHVLAVTPSGSVFAAGSNGRFARLVRQGLPQP